MFQDLKEISDGKIYTENDMVRVACQDCAGCHACCEQMGESVILDPLDIWRLCAATGKSFEKLLEKEIELHVVEGVILPNLAMIGEKQQCAFLNESGRCRIHAYRPGLCRVFPLGRIYEENRICYFLQTNACQKTERTKIKVSKWVDIQESRKNEQFLLTWHKLRRKIEEQIQRETNEQTIKTFNMFLLNLFFVMPYDTTADFYKQFSDRIKQAENVFKKESFQK